MIPIPPQAIAAAGSLVKSVVSKALGSVIAIVDPGKKRDANREARAQMWYEIANAGSITAARRVYGGQTIQFTDKERRYYVTRWAQLRASRPSLAAQAEQLKGLGIPEPGSDTAPPHLDDATIQQLQAEIDAFNSTSGTSSSTTPPLATVGVTSGSSGTTAVVALGAVAALIMVYLLVRHHS